MSTKAVGIWMIAIGLLGPQGAWAKDESAKGTGSETCVAQLDLSSLEKDSIVFSPDSRHVAYVVRAEGKKVVVLDGTAGEPYDDILENVIRFSPDGRHLAYWAMKNYQWLAIIDGKASEPYSKALTVPIFSPDSARVAYGAAAGEKQLVVVDGKAGDPCFSLGEYSIAFSPDSQHIAYQALPTPCAGYHSCEFTIVRDGIEGKRYSEITSRPRFSPDSQHLAYSARYLVVTDEKQGKAYDAVWRPDFTPDSQSVVYMARSNKKVFMVMGDREGAPFDEILTYSLFSQNGEQVSYVAKTDGKIVVVRNGIEGKKYDDYWQNSLAISPDGKRLGYIAKMGDKWVAVVDGKEEKRFDYGHPTLDSKNKINGWSNDRKQGTLLFSPDSKRVAYLAPSGSILRKTLRFSGQVMNIVAGVEDWYAVVDGREGKKYGDIPEDSLVFSPDGKHLAYGAEKGGKWVVVVDGKEGKPYDLILQKDGSHIVFDSPDTFHFFAMKGRGLYLVNASVASH